MSGTTKRLLWIDDEIEFLRAHVIFLETRGYAVTTASGGDEGIRLIRGSEPAFDIVLLDKQMPVRSGASTLDEIKAHWPELPVVILTGYQHAADVAMEDKYDGYLTKPVDPNGLLLECKRIIESKERASHKFTDRYMRGYTENKTRLGGVLSASGWMGLHTSLAMWDHEIDGVASEGVRQMQAGLKSDCSKKFCDFAIDNYADWAARRPGSGKPFMAVDVAERVVLAELGKGRSVLVMVLSGACLSQFLAIEPEVKRNFSVIATRFMSVLPTTSRFCLPSLVSGCYPNAVSELEPGIFDTDGALDSAAMKRLMQAGLERFGAEKVKAFYASADGVGGKRHLKATVEAMKKGPAYGVITLDIIDKLALPAFAGRPDKEPDEGVFRRLLESWFANSATLAMMKEVCGESCTVVLTSDHGHVYSRCASEIYETAETGRCLRNMFSGRVSVDEREIFLLEELSHFKLPAFAPGTKCLMARENYYFALHGRKRGAGSFQSGGISPEEMIMPLYICRPFGSAE